MPSTTRPLPRGRGGAFSARLAALLLLSLLVRPALARETGEAERLMDAPLWITESDQALASLGISVSTAGDVNGDGYSDVVVGAYLYDDGETDEGAAFLYLGSAGGPSTVAAWTATGGQAGAKFGQSVAAAGDVNGDGYDDVIVGALAYDDGETDEGRVFLYLGGPDGLSATPAWTAESDQAGAFFGLPVATAGDVNGDGYADLLVGALLYDHGESDEGAAFLYLGGPAGPGASPDWIGECNVATSYYGSSLGTAGDVNGDGYDDVIVGAPQYTDGQTFEGAAFVYSGGPAGLSDLPLWIAESDQAVAHLGAAVAGAGDVNGDGYADVVVGAPLYDDGQSNEGKAFVYLGGPLGPSATPDWSAHSGQALAQFGASVATAGDVDGDGYADVAIGVPFWDDGQTDEGGVFVYEGDASGLDVVPRWIGEGGQTSALWLQRGHRRRRGRRRLLGPPRRRLPVRQRAAERGGRLRLCGRREHPRTEPRLDGPRQPGCRGPRALPGVRRRRERRRLLRPHRRLALLRRRPPERGPGAALPRIGRGAVDDARLGSRG
ncbi:MAG: FG-GAP repeat protein [Candidatus Latescibacteria bacterium]|nr:FG-GAP repeat protein [Candidatus Latescibacterota bacterium]